MSNQDPWFQRYKFSKPLGQGGMGVVYLAFDKSTEKDCVIKQLISRHGNPDEHREAIRLFRREAKLLASLEHPGIVPILDYHVSSDGKYFLVMQYIKGKDLSTILNNFGPFDNEAAAEVGIQCCQVLNYLHAQIPPIIYRDLKPSNLMLTPEGKIIFIDFGIARILNPTQAATRVVTTGYSPPEQYFGKPETRSDLYALGTTLAHLLTASRPKPLTQCFPGRVNNLINHNLSKLIESLTNYDIEGRPKTAQDVLIQLKEIYTEIKGYPRSSKTNLSSIKNAEEVDYNFSLNPKIAFWQKLINWLTLKH